MKFFSKAKKVEKEEEKDKQQPPKGKMVQSVENEIDSKMDESSIKPAKKGLFSFRRERLDKQKDSATILETSSAKISDDSKGQPTENAANYQKTLEIPSKSEQSELSIEKITSEKMTKLIEMISAAKDNAIIPIINLEKNQISYPQLAQIGEDESNVLFLEKLASPEFDIFERIAYDRLMVCPDHKDYAVTLRLYCSSCNSLDLSKLQLLEHKTCGFIAEQKEFGIISDNDIITKCPGCEKPIRDMQKEIRKVGMWYQCNGCGVKLDNPIMKLRCRKFEHDFDINQARTVIVPYFKLKRESKSVANYLVSLAPEIKRVLLSYGYTVNESAYVKGKSGVSHQVSIFAANQRGKTVIVDIKGSKTEIEDSAMDSMLSKVHDISPSITIFVAMPSVSDKARTMANALNIHVISGTNFATIIEQVEMTLKSSLGQDDLSKI